jgi:hypothetical protein
MSAPVLANTQAAICDLTSGSYIVFFPYPGYYEFSIKAEPSDPIELAEGKIKRSLPAQGFSSRTSGP